MDLGSFFFMVLSFTGAAVIVVWSIALATAYAKRIAPKSTVPAQLRVEEIEERLVSSSAHAAVPEKRSRSDLVSSAARSAVSS